MKMNFLILLSLGVHKWDYLNRRVSQRKPPSISDGIIIMLAVIEDWMILYFKKKNVVDKRYIKFN